MDHDIRAEIAEQPHRRRARRRCCPRPAAASDAAPDCRAGRSRNCRSRAPRRRARAAYRSTSSRPGPTPPVQILSFENISVDFRCALERGLRRVSPRPRSARSRLSPACAGNARRGRGTSDATARGYSKPQILRENRPAFSKLASTASAVEEWAVTRVPAAENVLHEIVQLAREPFLQRNRKAHLVAALGNRRRAARWHRRASAGASCWPPSNLTSAGTVATNSTSG